MLAFITPVTSKNATASSINTATGVGTPNRVAHCTEDERYCIKQALAPMPTTISHQIIAKSTDVQNFDRHRI
ncbi:hypothetical protein PPTG_22640 [Phytophthora nicotianae INRA-310]|uniref:Uncharacterized protein n=2 Tax=Phytophthora nicotianae TaxID=4792 RepID=W2QEV2_PHYN3|nr:hypothetical protein PPTG_22640 [Phytophthora nicotianae INRA-310]ETN11054.1 hypothetical protein PPTG_22640 [Phytophthora nicotianae INRA-310]